MTTITVVRGESGELRGFTEKDRRAWAKYQKRVDRLQPGELMWFSTWFERSGPYHRRHMAMLGTLYDAQEQFGDFDDFRKWTQVGAGYCDFVPGPNGRMVALPRSIAYHKIDQAEIEDLHLKTKDFLRTARALEYLWGHLDENQRGEMIETLLAGFDE